MPRMMAACRVSRAKFGHSSQISIPGTAVAMGLKGPPCSVPGLRSKVSLWLGPPAIHSRMHDFGRALAAAAPRASAGNQPDSEDAITPAVDSRSHSRRLRAPNLWK
jgi:hypothetical protein